MKLLIVGGTSFVGRAIAWSAWHHGHQVTVVNRGITPSDLPESIEHLVGDRGVDLSVLNGHSFDATIDATAYLPGDVAMLARGLEDRGGHYVQISSISAYQNPAAPRATEHSLQLLTAEGVNLEGPVTGETYGPLKAACERAGIDYFGGQLTFVRPTYVIGAHDATLRFPYWVERVRKGGRVAVPGPRESAMEYIDARDLANLVVRFCEGHILGAFHAAGPEPGDHFIEMIEQIAAHLAPGGTTIEEVAPETVNELDLGAKFPLWSGGENPNILALDSSLARSHGLDLRTLGESIDDVVEWWADRAWPKHWLTSEDEKRLLDAQ